MDYGCLASVISTKHAGPGALVPFEWSLAAGGLTHATPPRRPPSFPDAAQAAIR